MVSLAQTQHGRDKGIVMPRPNCFVKREHLEALFRTEDGMESWNRFEAFEQAEIEGRFTTNLAQLAALGVEVPPPHALDDPSLPKVLWEIILGLARCHVFLLSTDHLDDRQLYEELWTKYLHQPVADVAPTVLHLLGLEPGAEMAGRILHELFVDGAETPPGRSPSGGPLDRPGGGPWYCSPGFSADRH